MRVGHSSMLQLMLAFTGAALNAAYTITPAAGRQIATHATAAAVGERAGLIVMGRPLRAAEVKRRLQRFNIATDGLFEAESLRDALAKLGASRGAMGAGVVVDESKCFWAVRLETEAAADASPLLFVLDSAASHSLISTEAARALGASATGVTATSATATADARQQGLSQVDLGQVSLTDGFECGALRPVVMDVPVAAAGLLGLDFLSRFDIELVLERALPRAVFHPKGSARTGDGITRGMTRLKGRRLPRSGLIVVPLRIQAAAADSSSSKPSARVSPPIETLVDLGSSSTVCNWAALAAAGIDRDDPRVKLTDNVIAGASGEPVRVSEVTLTLCFDTDNAGGGDTGGGGDQCVVKMGVADLPIFSMLGLNGPMVVLGLDAIGGEERGAPARVVMAAAEDCFWIGPQKA